MNYNDEINKVLKQIRKETSIKIVLKEDFKQDFNTIINTAWREPAEKQIVKVLFSNKDKILQDEMKGKAFLNQVFKNNKALIQNDCSTNFLNTFGSLTGQEITENKLVKYINNNSIKENKMYRYYKVQYLNESQFYVAVPPFVIETLMEHETVLGFALESKQIKTQKGVDYVVEVSEQEFDEVTTELEGKWGSKPTEGKPQDASIKSAKNKFDSVKATTGASQSNPKKLNESKWNFLFEDEDPCWKGYKAMGMKNKNGKSVPNCIPESEELEERLSANVCSKCGGTGSIEGRRCPSCGSGKNSTGYRESKEINEEFEQPEEGKFERTSYDSAANWGGEEIGDECSFCNGEGCESCDYTGKNEGIIASQGKYPSGMSFDLDEAEDMNSKLCELIDGNKSSLSKMRKPAYTPDAGADGILGEADFPEDEDEFQHMTKSKVKESKEYVDIDPVFKTMEKNRNMKVEDSTGFNVGKLEDSEGFKGLRDFYTQYGLTDEEVVDDTTNDFGSPISESFSARLQREINEAEKIDFDEKPDEIEESSAAWDKATGKSHYRMYEDMEMVEGEEKTLYESGFEDENLNENDTSDMSIPDAIVGIGKNPKKVNVYGEDNDEEYIEDDKVLQEKFIKFILKNCQNAKKYNNKGKFNLKEFLNNKSIGFLKLLEKEFEISLKRKLNEDDSNGEFEIEGYSGFGEGETFSIQYYYPSDESEREIDVSNEDFIDYMENTDPNWSDKKIKPEEGELRGELASGDDIEGYWSGYSNKQQAMFLKQFLIVKRGVSKKL